MIFRIFALKEELTQIEFKIEKVNSALQKVKTLEYILTTLLSR